MKKTLIMTTVALGLCMPTYAAGYFLNPSTHIYTPPQFSVENDTKSAAELREQKEINKEEEQQFKEDKKAEVMPIRLNAEHAEYDSTSGDFHASGNVVIRQGHQRIQTEYAKGNLKTGDIWVEKGAEFKDEASKLQGGWGYYNINTKTGELTELNGRTQKDFFQAKHAQILPDKLVLDQGGRASRCPAVAHPACLSVEAKTIEYYPNDKIVAHDVKVFMKGKHIYSRNIWVNRFDKSTRTWIMPRFGFSDSKNGGYVKLEFEQPVSKHDAVAMELVRYSKAGYKPQYQLKHEERNWRLAYFNGWDEYDDIWYRKQNNLKFEYKPQHFVKGIPLTLGGYYQRGLWNAEHKDSVKSWHSEGAAYLSHDPIHIFSNKTALNLVFGKKWVNESYTKETKNSDMFYYTLGHKFSDKWCTWVGYYKENRTTNLFNYGQPDMEQELRNGIQFSPDQKNVYTIVNRYDYKNHAKYETDYRWLHKFCCWAMELSYEKEWAKRDHSLKVHFYFYNW